MAFSIFRSNLMKTVLRQEITGKPLNPDIIVEFIPHAEIVPLRTIGLLCIRYTTLADMLGPPTFSPPLDVRSVWQFSIDDDILSISEDQSVDNVENNVLWRLRGRGNVAEHVILLLNFHQISFYIEQQNERVHIHCDGQIASHGNTYL